MIGVFDSGLGGLSVWRALKVALPGRATLYLADQAHVPYGGRPLDEVRALSLRCLDWMVDRGARTIVIACNTATACAADDARARWPDTAFVGIEPALKPAAQNSQTGVVAVLATQATFDSPRYAALAARHADRVSVIARACPGWVQLVEDGPSNRFDAGSMVASQIWPLLDAGADQLVLGCTHFPFLLPWIDQAIALWRANTGIVRAIGVIDPAPAVARQAVRVERAGIARLDSDVFWTTGDPLAFCRGARDTLGLEWKGAAARKAHPDDRGHDPI